MWIVYLLALLALLLGCVNVFDTPARQSFISGMVPPENLANAVTLNSISMNMARVFGAALGGVIAVVGTLAWEFQVSLPLMASKVFSGGAGTYGLMASVMGAGAVAGGLVSAARNRPRARTLCVPTVICGLLALPAMTRIDRRHAAAVAAADAGAGAAEPAPLRVTSAARPSRPGRS